MLTLGINASLGMPSDGSMLTEIAGGLAGSSPRTVYGWAASEPPSAQGFAKGQISSF